MLTKNLLKLSAALLGIILVLAFLEAVVRETAPQITGTVLLEFDPEIGYIPVPNFHGRKIFPATYDYTYTNGPHGLRTTSHPMNHRSNPLFKILFLGDSFTYGVGVNDDQTFVSQVEHNLATHADSIQTLNAGEPGAGTEQELKFFNMYGKQLKPNLTVLCFFANDFDDNFMTAQHVHENWDYSLHFGKISRLAARSKLLNWFLSRSHLLSLIKTDIILLSTRLSLEGYQHSSENFSNPQNITITQEYLKTLKKKILQSGSHFMAFYIPTQKNVEKYRKTHELSQDEKILNQLLGLKNDSLTIFLANTMIPSDLLYYTEGHWTALAHKLAAQYVTQLIFHYAASEMPRAKARLLRNPTKHEPQRNELKNSSHDRSGNRGT